MDDLTQENNITLSHYMTGFNDELTGNENLDTFTKAIYRKAYKIGRLDALVGDDLSSNDYQTDEQILNKIINLYVI